MKQQLIQEAARLISQSQAIIICTGAGMGVDSGLPDFRGTEGFWQAYPALAKANLRFESIASPSHFQTDPALAWGFYGHRLQLYRDTVPHAGFDLLKRWASEKAGGYHVFTSNVDGQFQKAGFDPNHIEECHGSIHHVQCSRNCCESIWHADSIQPHVDTEHCLWLGPVPTCPQCGAVLRPNILMFNDGGWIETRWRLQASQRDSWLDSLWQQRLRPVIIEIGAGTAVPSVRNFASTICNEFSPMGARLIRINSRQPEVSDSDDVGLALGALGALTAIDAALKSNAL